MWEFIQHVQKVVFHAVSHLDRLQAGVAVAVLLAVGIFCMRGFGSRMDY